MRINLPKPQYLIDNTGKKTFVVLRVEEYEELIEDLHDLATIAERRGEKSLSLEEFEEGLKNDGFL